MNELDDILADAERDVAGAGTLAALDEIRVRLLGKKGSLTALLKRLGALPAAERRSLVPAGRPGELTVRAVMTAPQGAARLEAELALRLVTPLQASPAQLVVFNHPATREAVQLTGGSGHVAVRVATPAQSSLAAFTFHPENSSVSVAPRADGRLTLDVWDLCLTATPPATVAVQVR